MSLFLFLMLLNVFPRLVELISKLVNPVTRMGHSPVFKNYHGFKRFDTSEKFQNSLDFFEVLVMFSFELLPKYQVR